MSVYELYYVGHGGAVVRATMCGTPIVFVGPGEKAVKDYLKTFWPATYQEMMVRSDGILVECGELDTQKQGCMIGDSRVIAP